MPTDLSGRRARDRIARSAAVRSAVALLDAAWRAPGEVERVPIVGAAAAQALDARRPFSVLVWNVQFCAGRTRKFFYDGGDAVRVDPEAQRSALDRVARVLRDQRADLVLLQEVDRGSDRTDRVDQHAELLARAPYPCHASAPYHRVRYVPFPAGDHLGRVDTHLSVFSRFSLADGRRRALPTLVESWVRRQFNLRRAILEADAPLADGRRVRIANLHLSAFSQGDGTLTRQVAKVATRLEDAGPLALFGGDFNALPPGDDPERLGADADQYRADGDVLGVLFDRYRSAIPREAHADEPERWRTWMPFGSTEPDRALDHVFTGTGLEVLDAAVLSGVSDVSDHLPVRVEVQVAGAP